MTPTRDHDICIIGGAGHVGLPLALVFARRRPARPRLRPEPRRRSRRSRAGRCRSSSTAPSRSWRRRSRDGSLAFSSDASDIARADTVIVAVGHTGRRVSESEAPGAARSVQEASGPISIPSRPSSSGARCFPARAATCCGCCRRTAGTGTSRIARSASRRATRFASSTSCPQIVSGCSDEARRARHDALRADCAADRSGWRSRKRSWPSCSRTRGGTSSSPRPTSST